MVMGITSIRDLRSKEEAAQLDERQAAMLAEQGFSGLVGCCICWYDSVQTIEEKTEPWKQALAIARRT